VLGHRWSRLHGPECGWQVGTHTHPGVTRAARVPDCVRYCVCVCVRVCACVRDCVCVPWCGCCRAQLPHCARVHARTHAPTPHHASHTMQHNSTHTHARRRLVVCARGWR
jgi:hypothetical protein